MNDFPISENSMTACLNYTLLHETKHALCRRIVRCNPACLTFVVVVVVFKPMPSVSVEGTLLGLTITNWSRVNLAFASLCNTFSSDTALKAAAAVSARNINTRFLCCVYVSNHRSTGVTLNGSQIRAYWSESKTDADGGLWLQPACQAAGLDVCSYIIKKEKKKHDGDGSFCLTIEQLWIRTRWIIRGCRHSSLATLSLVWFCSEIEQGVKARCFFLPTEWLHSCIPP